jgi:cytochrome d ubiquinol oxidase subunit I
MPADAAAGDVARVAVPARPSDQAAQAGNSTKATVAGQIRRSRRTLLTLTAWDRREPHDLREGERAQGVAVDAGGGPVMTALWLAAELPLPPPVQAYLDQARQMQALSFAVHIPMVCFGIALPTIVLVVESLHLRTGDELYLVLARRWTRMMAALFAVGAITGTILSFEMGLLWPAFTAQFGSVFGLGFAIEGFSFFTEAIFIGIYIYGWDRLSPRAHFATGFPIAIAGVIGSFMVIAVNAWMNHPGGFTLRDGQVVEVHPVQALFANTYLWHELVHMYIAGYIVVGFVLAGVYAVAWLRGRWGRYERTAFAIPMTVGALAAPVQVLVGDWAGREVAQYQPVKLAGMEGLANTTAGAPLHLLGWFNGSGVDYGIAIPKGLSFLAFHNFNAVVPGLNIVPRTDWPIVNVVRLCFQTMVGIGSLLALIGVIYLVVRIRRHRLPGSAWFYRAVGVAGPLSVVALICGWVVTEVGRQPWVVYGVMRTTQAVTAASVIPVGYGVLLVVYGGVIVGVVWIMRRLAAIPLEPGAAAPAPTTAEGR